MHPLQIGQQKLCFAMVFVWCSYFITFAKNSISPTCHGLGLHLQDPGAGADLPGGGVPGAPRLRHRPRPGHHGDQEEAQDTEVRYSVQNLG